MSKLYREHTCSSLPCRNISVMTLSGLTGVEGDNQWVLYISSPATEEDLEQNPHLEYVGELMQSATLSIKHCPYCGLELQKESAEPLTSSLNPECCDASGYYSQSL